jgi:hypothetical protein
MCIRIIRTPARPSASPYARAIEPGRHRPNAAPRALGVALGGVVVAMGVMRPIQREPLVDKLFTEIDTADLAARDRAPKGVE